MTKRWFAICLCALLCVYGMAARADDASLNGMPLLGAEGHKSGADALYLHGKGLFFGDENGKANLDDPVTRAECLALFVRCFYSGDEVLTDVEPFADVAMDAWYYDITLRARMFGLTVGDGNNNFLPADNVTREQVALMTHRQTGIYAMFITDIPDVSPEYKYYDAINYVVSYGIMDSVGGFRPTDYATRGDVVAALATILRSTDTAAKPSVFDESGESSQTAETAATAIPVVNISEVAMINMTWQQMYRKGIPFPENMPPRGVDVISPTWFSITREETADKTADLYPLGNGFYLQSYADANYMDAAHMKGIQVWPMFKREDKLSREQVSAFLNDPAARAASIAKLVELSDTLGFEGINVDFEYMFETDKDAFTNYMRELYAATQGNDLTLSIDINHYDPSSPSWSLPYDRAALAQTADYIALMAYDEYAAGSSTPGPVASLPWVGRITEMTLKEVPANKLILGIPFYTRIWQLDGNGKVIKSTAVGFPTQEKTIIENNPTITFDEKNGLNVAEWSNTSGKYKMWLEDDYSLARRVFLAQSLGLAGIASWSSNFSQPDTWTLVDMILLGQ